MTRSAKRFPTYLIAPSSLALVWWGCYANPGVLSEPTGDAGSNVTPVTTELPCEVNAVFEKACRNCHSSPPKFGAPIPLVTHADLTANTPSYAGKKVYEAVGMKINDPNEPMPPSSAPVQLSPSEKTILNNWIAAGAPKGDPSQKCEAVKVDSGVATVACNPDIKISPKTKYTMPKDLNDAYMCYGVDVPVSAKRHITAIVPKIDNANIVHHVVVLEAPNAVSGTHVPCNGATAGRMVFAWAPGGVALELPPEAGFPVEGTAHYVVQMHYNNTRKLEGEQDGSGVDFCSTDKLRANDADIMAFGTHDIRIKPQSSFDTTCSIQAPPEFMQSLTFFAGFPHMHQLGDLMETKLLPKGGGAPQDMGSQSVWDFKNQPFFKLNVKVNPGDVITTRCKWTNPSPTNTVVFGENTDNEMCYNFAMYYPRVILPQWSWALPAATSKCVSN
ncbi:MAG: peptidylglycine alpha-amidating monooxygenase [Polyangiaceae bacterium]|nr:peptidylglycine alpha-amidating monooxygenase [Polyangiaceae bacterium]